MNRSGNPHPVSHGSDFAEGHASLRHSPWTGVHSKKEYALSIAAELPKVLLMHNAGIQEGIVYITYRMMESDLRARTRKTTRLVNEIIVS
jgi:hypothetical protein